MDVGPTAAEEKYTDHPPPHLMTENPTRIGFDFQFAFYFLTSKLPEIRQCPLFFDTENHISPSQYLHFRFSTGKYENLDGAAHSFLRWDRGDFDF